ncbi:structural cement protein Gp24 [Heyndrickxia coagulans]|uniref:structural cement protein Gp24 n=1 Tax=Heyndrickxia coagulans TaxID=1398 RepID=UPI0022364608|nr:hypothetical protein [Heyndrickxia coagulans]UZH06391.1 hypothetical protein ONG97_00155 [Heyndrickxia coagulans]
MPILSYEQYMPEELGKGKVASYHDHRADTEAAGAPIDWGVAVQRKADDPEHIVTYDGTGKFIGVAIANIYAETRLPDISQGVDGHYEQYDVVPVLRRGIVFVEVLEDVIKGDEAVIDNATGNFRPKGTATTAVSASVGVFKTSASAGNLAQLEVNLP